MTTRKKNDLVAIKVKNNLSKSLHKVNWKNADWLLQYFTDSLGYNTSLAILSSILRESGADPHRKQVSGGPGRGLVQWEDYTKVNNDRFDIMSRYKMKGKKDPKIDPELQRQAEYIKNTVLNKSEEWTHGGVSSGYNKAEDARHDFINRYSTPLLKAKAFSLGYVRPKGKVEEANFRADMITSLDSIYNPEIDFSAKPKNNSKSNFIYYTIPGILPLKVVSELKDQTDNFIKQSLKDNSPKVYNFFYKE